MGTVVAFHSRACLFDAETMDGLRPGHEDPKLKRALRSLAPTTRKTYRHGMLELDRFLVGRALTDQLLSDYLESLHEEKKLSPATIRTRVAAIRFRAESLGQADPIGPLTKGSLRMIRREGSARGRGSARGLSQSEIEQIISDTSSINSLWSSRDSALIAVGYFRGLRVSEIVGIKVEHLIIDESGKMALMIPKSKTDQSGKGCILGLHEKAAKRINDWLEVSGIRSGYIFIGIMTCGYEAPPQVSTKGMTSVHAARIIAKRSLAAGYEGVSSHSLRRSFAQALSGKGWSTHRIASEGRWSDLSSVLRYTQRSRAVSSEIHTAFD